MNMLYNSENQHYTKDFYELTRDYSRQSAEVIVPLILKFIPCNSVVDVGCGDGTWLQIFQERGVKEILGIDGNYVDEAILKIPKKNFSAYDLQKKLNLNKEFNLVVSLEVAEHLPESSADLFVDSLVSLGSIILFSAAIPHQSGPGHLNEQWQQYWFEKFHQRGYIAVDYIRPKVWHNQQVAYWYSQNTMLYIKQDYWEDNPSLQDNLKIYKVHELSSISLVHPTLYLIKLGVLNFWGNVEDNNSDKKESIKLLPSFVNKLIVVAKKYFK